MHRIAILIAALLGLFVSQVEAQTSDVARVRVETSMGEFVIEMSVSRSPLTVANFLEYVRAGFYDGTVFHRVINNFVVQGGGFDDKYAEKPTRPTISNESGNGVSNRRGTVGMARSGEPHSANTQFYVNLADNAALDPQASRWGYTVFGTVVEGMEVLDAIGGVATGQAGRFDSDAPLKPVVIKRIAEVK